MSRNFTITLTRKNRRWNTYFPFEATVGLAPTNGGFADRCVSYFTTWPLTYILYNIFDTNINSTRHKRKIT